MELEAPDAMTPEQLKRYLDDRHELRILDVRTAEERLVGHIAGSLHIPLGELPGRIHELNPEETIVVHCKLGGRSAQAVAFLRQQGFTKVYNLSGGLAAWAAKIDPSIAVG